MPVEFKESSIKEWIINNLEEGQIADVVLEGCVTGIVSELIYFADSCAFYEKYKEEIWQRLYDSAQDCDEHQNCLHTSQHLMVAAMLHLTSSSGTCWRGTHAKKCVVRLWRIKMMKIGQQNSCPPFLHILGWSV